MIRVMDMGSEVLTIEWSEKDGKVTVGKTHIFPKSFYRKIMERERK